MANEVETKRGLKLRLNNGTDADGKTLTVDVSLSNVLGGLSLNEWDVDKAASLANACETVLSKTINTVVTTMEGRITN